MNNDDQIDMANDRGWGGARFGSGPKLKPWKTKGMLEEVLRRHKHHIDENDEIIDPLSWWVMILNDPEAPPSRRDMAAAKLAEYTVAKPKPVHSDGSSNNRIEVVITDFTRPTAIAAAQNETLLIDAVTTNDDDDE